MQFTEKQYFTQILVWILLIGIFISSLIPIFKHHDPSIITILIYTSPIIIVMFLFAIMNLQTSINSKGISIVFFPFHRNPKIYRWENIDRVELLKYSPLFEYGGWGIRGIGDDKAYNIRGNIGLKLFLKNGNKILIGTQKSADVLKTLSEITSEKGVIFTIKL